FFNVRYPVVPGHDNSESVVDGLPITGIGISVMDNGTSNTYPVVGIFLADFVLDPSGNTPDLSQPISSVASPPITVANNFDFEPVDLPEGSIPPGTPAVQAVVQLPPGDSGLLGVGSDSTFSASDSSGFTLDGYTTPSITLSFLDFGMNPG